MYIPVKAPLALEFKYVVPTDFSRLLTSLVSIVYFADRNFYHMFIYERNSFCLPRFNRFCTGLRSELCQ